MIIDEEEEEEEGDDLVYPMSDIEEVIFEWGMEPTSNNLELTVDKRNDFNNFSEISNIIKERVNDIRKKANTTEVKNFYNSSNIKQLDSTTNNTTNSNINSLFDRLVPVTQNKSILSVSVDTRQLLERNKEHSEEFCQIIRNSIKNIKSVNNFITPYDSIKIDDFNLIDYYFKDLILIKGKEKRKLTWKKVAGESYYMPPIPSEVIERCKKRHEDFDVRFHYHSYPNKDTHFGYGFKVVCEKFGISHYFKVGSREKMPSAYVREYTSQKILKMLYPNVNRWLDLLNILDYRISV